MKRRSNIEIFSLSFLDCVCCGFGALILLLVLSKTAEPIIFEEYSSTLDKTILELELQLNEMRGESHILNRELVGKKNQLSINSQTITTLQTELTNTLSQFSVSKDDSVINNKIEGQLASAKQDLTEEIKRLQELIEQDKFEPDSTVGGIPVDSEYIIFIIDTSGSMYRHGWSTVQQKISEVLDVYPEVKGIQVMNDMGEYMFNQYAGRWISDTPNQRREILKRLENWQAFSNSSPVEGIIAAIRTFYSKDKRISLYVFGDEFTGPSINRVLSSVSLINKEDQRGNRRVRIHAIGFPIQFKREERYQITGIRFATLMRALCEQNGGAFVGLNEAVRK